MTNAIGTMCAECEHPRQIHVRYAGGGCFHGLENMGNKDFNDWCNCKGFRTSRRPTPEPVLIPVCDDHMTSLHTRLQSRVVFCLIDNTPGLGYYTRCGGLGPDGRDCKNRASHKAEVN